MHWLQAQLAKRDTIILAPDTDKTTKDLEAAAGAAIHGWRSPLGAVRGLLPEAEHGLDKTARKLRNDLRTFASWPSVLREYRRHELLRGTDEELWVPLLRQSRDLFVKYVHGPRASLARGQDQAAGQCLGLLHTAWELDMDLDRDAQRLADWRQKLLDAFRALRNKVEGPWRVFWGDDPFLFALISQKTELNIRDFPPKDLSFVILGGVREPLRKDSEFLRALALHEQAERQQARAQATHKPPPRRVWESVDEEWRRFVDRFGVRVASAEPRADILATLEQGPWALLVVLDADKGAFKVLLEHSPQYVRVAALEYVMTDVHRTAAARYLRASAQASAGRRAAALAELARLEADLKELTNTDSGRKSALLKEVDSTRAAARGSPADITRLATWQRDLGPDGGLAALARAARRRAQEIESAKADK
jgi:hypothetical protein